MKIAYVFSEGRESRRSLLGTGEIPSEFFYGGEELRAQGHDVRYLEIDRHAGSPRLRATVDLMFKFGFLPNRCRSHELMGTRAVIRQLADADVVVATSTGLAFALGLWRKAGMRVPPVVSIHCGLFNYPPNVWRRALIGWLLRESWSVVFGVAEAEPMRRIFRVPAPRVIVNQFGVDTEFWCPGPADSDGSYLLAVGNDARRDYPGLLEAARRLGPSYPVKILTRLSLPTQRPDHVEILHGDWKARAVSDLELRELYRSARIVITPLMNSLQPAGQSVTLQAMACARPVILTRTDGLWDPARIIDGANITLIPPGDTCAWADSIAALWHDNAKRRELARAARESVMRHFSIERFADGIWEACRSASGCA